MGLHFRRAGLIKSYSELNVADIGSVSSKDNVDDWVGFGFDFVAGRRNESVLVLVGDSQRSSCDFYHFG